MHGLSQTDDRGPHIALGQADDEVFGIDPKPARAGILFGTHLPGVGHRQQEGAGGADQRFARSRHDLGEGVEGSKVGAGRSGHVARLHQVMPERRVDDPVGFGWRCPKAAGVVQVTTAHLRAHG